MEPLYNKLEEFESKDNIIKLLKDDIKLLEDNINLATKDDFLYELDDYLTEIKENSEIKEINLTIAGVKGVEPLTIAGVKGFIFWVKPFLKGSVEPLTIYVLQLENNKYYVGKTTQLDFRIQNHDNGIGSAWTKKYKPIKILKLFPNCDNYDEDKYTRMYIVSVHPG